MNVFTEKEYAKRKLFLELPSTFLVICNFTELNFGYTLWMSQFSSKSIRSYDSRCATSAARSLQAECIELSLLLLEASKLSALNCLCCCQD